MMTSTRLRYLWCVLTGGMLCNSLFSGTSSIPQGIAAYGSNRWVHFLLYMAVVTIPVIAWRRRGTVLFFFGIAVIGSAIDAVQVFMPAFRGRPQFAIADLFGIAAGILLGLNIRMMRRSAKMADIASSEPFRPAMPEL